MAPPPVETFSEETLRELYKSLRDKEDWDNVCKLCKLPTMLHTDVQGNRIHWPCTRNQELTQDDVTKEWTAYSKRLKTIRSWYKEEMRTQNLEEKVNNIINIQHDVTTAIKEIQKGTTNKLIKLAKVPTWSKGMQLRPFIKSLEVWMENNKDLPEHSKYNEVIESLKLNKEIEGLSLYIGEHIVTKLDTVGKQTVKGII